MRILLITYDFPPVRSPRALRWRYLTRELALLGHEVHVLCPDLGPAEISFPQQPGSVVLHRGFAGPLGWVQRRSVVRAAIASASPLPAEGVARGATLNWRGRVVDGLKRLGNQFLFPDVRAEWLPWARPALRHLLRTIHPDLVISSHEPALTLLLGRLAKRAGYPWVADLGDPVCAQYTPRRWRRRALRLERYVCRHADQVMVTTQATKNLLIDRHAQDSARCAVLPNGYDDRRVPDANIAGAVVFDPHRLELVHSGRLYTYRDPLPFLQTLQHCPDVRLTLILPDPPDPRLAMAIRAAGPQVRVLGPLSHADVMGALQQADVLLNFGDVGATVQVPAKVYEYLGVARPILHVVTGNRRHDPVVQLLEPLRRSWFAQGGAARMGTLLRDLAQRKQQGTLLDGLDIARRNSYGHTALGRTLSDLLGTLVPSVRGPTESKTGEAA